MSSLDGTIEMCMGGQGYVRFKNMTSGGGAGQACCRAQACDTGSGRALATGDTGWTGVAAWQ